MYERKLRKAGLFLEAATIRQEVGSGWLQGAFVDLEREGAYTGLVCKRCGEVVTGSCSPDSCRSCGVIFVEGDWVRRQVSDKDKNV